MILALNALPQKIVANGEAFLREGVADDFDAPYVRIRNSSPYFCVMASPL